MVFFFVMVLFVCVAGFFLSVGIEMVEWDQDLARRQEEMEELKKEQAERHARYAAEREKSRRLAIYKAELERKGFE